jgi:hypothetical protein
MVIEMLCWCRAEANASAIAVARVGYVPSAEAERKAADLHRRLNEALKVVWEKTTVANEWQQRAKDAESKLAAEQVAVSMQHKEYAALESSVQGSCQKTFGEWLNFIVHFSFEALGKCS